MTNMNVDATQLTTKPSLDGYCMPAEWAPQQAVWMIWPYRPDNWRSAGAYAQATFAKVADAIGAVTPVYMGVPKEFLAQAKTVMPSHVTLVEIDSNDCWARDTGPTVVVNAKGECRGVDWGFNAWGGNNGGLYFPWDKDEQVAQQVLTQHGFERYQAPLILEGGSIHVDGEGTCMTTAECLLNSNRNPNLTREQIEALLADYLNVQQFVWLPEGVYMDETDGHIDNICCFARPGEVVLHWTDDQTDPQYPRSKAALDILQNTVDAQGRKLKVHLLPQPGPLYCTEEEAQGVVEGTGVPRTAGERLAGSYANFLITNNRIVFPLLDPATDDIAAQKLQEIFPEYEVVGVPAREILLGGGNIHCITQQIPSGK